MRETSTSTMDKRIEDFCSMLNDTGVFDELEIKVLKALLSLRNDRHINKCTASEISKGAGISVTNAYKYLYSLQSWERI